MAERGAQTDASHRGFRPQRDGHSLPPGRSADGAERPARDRRRSDRRGHMAAAEGLSRLPAGLLRPHAKREQALVPDVGARRRPRLRQHRESSKLARAHGCAPVSRAAASRPSRVVLIAALATLYVVWGSTYLAIAIVVDEVPPLTAAGARFLLAGWLLG